VGIKAHKTATVDKKLVVPIFCHHLTPRNKRKGFYRLSINDDFGRGYFGHWRTGEWHAWHSRSDKKYTAEEKRAFAKKIKEDKERADREKEERHRAMAVEAQDTILFLNEASADHPYISHKGIKPYRSLAYEDKILLPIHDDKEVWSYQTIDGNGNKYILKGARKQGNWLHIEGDEIILLCEGYATGCSLHEATGHTVYVCFDAYNLITAGGRIRKANPGAKIIVGADNDQDKEKAAGKNTGIQDGIKAATALKADIVWPTFEKGSGLSDFNDLHKLNGLEAVKNRIREAGRRPPRPEEAAGGVLPSNPDADDSQTPGGDLSPQVPDWQDGLQLTSKGEVVQRSTVNLLLIVANDEELNGVFVYDSFAKRIIVCRCPPWEDPGLFRVRQLQDYDYVRLEAWLENKWALRTGKARIADAIESTATLPFNTINPASEYFKSLIWDGIPRLDGWLNNFVSDKRQPPEYLSLVGKKFLCGLAARAMSPGIKFDTMIILEGRQYAGKSFLSKVMATVNGEEYFLDDFKDIENKDALMKMQGKLIIEFPEISTMRKAEVNDLKAFLSRTHDVFRPPYGRNTIEAGRQCVFVGTVNPEGPYLRDVTGNRRYWPISCRDKLEMGNLQEIMPMLHAEAAHLVKNGEQLWLKDDEYQLCVIEQDKRVMTDIWIDKIEEIVRGRDEITTDDLLMELCIPVEKRNQIVYTRLMQSMIALGFVSDRIGVGRTRKRGYRKIGSQASLIIEEPVDW
jgi:putative DNA primase/helicase